jgi:D-alanyl-D-alanine carboxypeptidase
VNLDAPLTTYISELPDERVPTVRQTLQHTAGFPNPIPVGWVHLAVEDDAFDDEAFFARILRKHGRLVAKPGERFAYSNVGYLMLGEVVRRVSGLPYDQYVEQEVIGALELRPGDVLDFTIPDVQTHARGYLRAWSFLDLALGLFLDRKKFIAGTHDGWNELADLYADGDAYGGIIANSGGLQRYLQAILRGDGPFTAADVVMMSTPGMTRSGQATAMGLGWFTGDVDGEPYFAHAGGGGGYYCEIRVYPNARRASILLTNRSAMNDERALDGLDRHLLSGEATH